MAQDSKIGNLAKRSRYSAAGVDKFVIYLIVLDDLEIGKVTEVINEINNNGEILDEIYV